MKKTDKEEQLKRWPLLSTCDYPCDVRNLSESELSLLSCELREYLIEAVSDTGGHLGASLGVVDLTIALHYVFDTPRDILIWDVGHQSYPHKILTGRRGRFLSLRKGGGLSGFTSRQESEYDHFGAGHSSTSISAALGFAVARDLEGRDEHVVAVIGDGALSAGMAYEAMNNVGAYSKRMIVILNDNDMSIARPVGAMSSYLSRLLSSRSYLGLRELARSVISRLPSSVEAGMQRAEEHARGMLLGGTLFEELGFYYLGPVEGHKIENLLPMLEASKNFDRPVLLHVVTEKGKGYAPAEDAHDRFHGVSSFDVATGRQKKTSSTKKTYTRVFSDSLCSLAAEDDKLVAITAAMPSGTGLDRFGELYKERLFDVGIAEQHAVTFGAGLAAGGYRPFVAIYSTFLQRAYDQIVHDVAIQSLGVRFAIDRAGFVGADGATHSGSFDITYLCCLPNFVVMAASDGNELQRMIKTAHVLDDVPSAFRYPKGDVDNDIELSEEQIKPLKLGKGKIIYKGSKVAILSFGARLESAKLATLVMKKEGYNVTLADARFAKPLDRKLIKTLVEGHDCLITIEEGSVGGFSSQVMQCICELGLWRETKIIPMVFPDKFIEQDSIEHQYKIANLDSESILKQIRSNI